MLPSLAFLTAALILAVTPGPAMTYVVARTLTGGRAEGLLSSAGTAVGGMLHVAAAAAGLSLLLLQSALAFSVLKWLGAAYLIYLGLRQWRGSTRTSERPAGSESAAALPTVSTKGSGSALRDGFWVEVLNVKTALFFLAFIPQFVQPVPSMPLQFAVMGTVCVALNTTTDVIAVLAAHRVMNSGWMRGTRQRLMQRLSGSVLVGLGLWVALARRPA